MGSVSVIWGLRSGALRGFGPGGIVWVMTTLTTQIDELPAIAGANIGSSMRYVVKDPTTGDMARMDHYQLADLFKASETAGSETAVVSGVTLSNAVVVANQALTPSFSGSERVEVVVSAVGCAVGDHVICTVRSITSVSLDDVAVISAQAETDQVRLLLLGTDPSTPALSVDLLILRTS